MRSAATGAERSAAPSKTFTSKTFTAFIEASGIDVRDMRGWRVHPDIATRAFEIAVAAGDPQRALPYRIDLEAFSPRIVAAAHDHAHGTTFDDDDVAQGFPGIAKRLWNRGGEAAGKAGITRAALTFDEATLVLAVACERDEGALFLAGPGAAAPRRRTRGTPVPATTSRMPSETGDDEPWPHQRIAGPAASWREAARLMELLARCAPPLREDADGRGGIHVADRLFIETASDHGPNVFFGRRGSDWIALDPDERDVPDWFVEATQTIEARFHIGPGRRRYFEQGLHDGQSAALAAARRIGLEEAKAELARRLVRVGAPRGGALARIVREAEAGARKEKDEEKTTTDTSLGPGAVGTDTETTPEEGNER